MEINSQAVLRLMLSRGWSDGELSRVSGLNRRTIHAMRNGIGRPNISTIHRVARALEVSETELLKQEA